MRIDLHVVHDFRHRWLSVLTVIQHSDRSQIQEFHKAKVLVVIQPHYRPYDREQDSSPTRQFTDTFFEDSSPTDLKTVHRHF